MNQYALITGATAGIGKASAEILAKNGYHLILIARRENLLNDLKNKLETENSIQCFTFKIDVRKREEVFSISEKIKEITPKIDILVNNAGLAMGLSSVEDGNLDHWDTMIDTNVKGLLYMTKMVLNFMIPHQSGHIINIGSIAGKEVYANGNVYCSTKHAVDALSRSMRLDLSKHSLKVSAIHPGAVETEFSIVRFEGDTERAKKVYEGFENLVAEDIADALWFIVSRPIHVNINEMTIMPKAQPMAGVIHRKNS